MSILQPCRFFGSLIAIRLIHITWSSTLFTKKRMICSLILMLTNLNIVSYGRIYCLQIDRVAMLLHSYRFYQDAVVQQVIPFSNFLFSVTDNLGYCLLL
jgi:hypothetical protein